MVVVMMTLDVDVDVDLSFVVGSCDMCVDDFN